MQPLNDTQRAVIGAIERAADAHSVPRRVALAFAWCESRLDPTCEGDLSWHERDGGSKYARLVLNNPRFGLNPWRKSPELWHSYGLFQLLAPYFCRPEESPRALLDPEVNSSRGCIEIARLLALTKGDVQQARLAYVGCGPTGAQCGQAVKDNYVARLNAALQQFQGAGS